MPESPRTAGPAAVEKCGIKAHEGKIKRFLLSPVQEANC